MAQYRTGLASVALGSSYVTGSDTLWDSVGNITEGCLFNIRNSTGWYYIASIDSNTSLSLTAPYAGTSQNDVEYVIIRDFIGTQSLPLINYGDVNWPSIYTEAMRKISIALGSGEEPGVPTGSDIGLDAAYGLENSINVDAAPVILNRIGTYGSENEASALQIVDYNTSGAESGMPPLSGALLFAQSKHRIPIVAVTNDASRDDANSPSNTAPVALIALANADSLGSFDELGLVFKNVGVMAASVDYHDKYGCNPITNVGLFAYSQKGYGIFAGSDEQCAIYVDNGVADGVFIRSPKPLYVDSSIHDAASGTFALTVKARKAGVYIDGTETPSLSYPSIYVNATNAGIAGNFTGQTVFGRTGGVTLVATSDTYPAIQSTTGIQINIANHATITNAQEGTLVYSGVASGLQVYHNSAWHGVITESTSESVTLDSAYNNSITQTASAGIDIHSGAVRPLTLTSTDQVAFRVRNTSITAGTGTGVELYTRRGWGIIASSEAPTNSYGIINANTTGGVVLNATTTTGKLINYTTSGVTNDYAVTMNAGTGGGISVTVVGESTSFYSPLKVVSDQATLIDASTETGKLISYTANVGAEGYAINLNTRLMGGIYASSTGSTDNMLRLVNTNTAATLVYMNCGGGNAMTISSSKKGIDVTSDTDYAILATRSQGPAIKCNGIVSVAGSTNAISNPENGTIVYSVADGILFYYVESLGWVPIGVPEGYESPSGSGICTCICGINVFCEDKDLIAGEDREEGTILYDGSAGKVYFVDFDKNYVEIGTTSGGGGEAESYTVTSGSGQYYVTESDRYLLIYTDYPLPAHGFVHLLPAATTSGKVLTIKRTTITPADWTGGPTSGGIPHASEYSYFVNIIASGAEYIDQAHTYKMSAPQEVVNLLSDGTKYYKI